METDTLKSSRIDDETTISASILATEASINAKMKQLSKQVRTEVGGVVDKVNAIQDVVVDVTNAVNIKRHVQESPFKMLAFSALAGLFAGGIIRGSRSQPVPEAPRPIATGPGVFSLLAIGILRPVLTDIVREVAHRSLNPRKVEAEPESMNGSSRPGHITH